jgi:hypothetical protein
MHTSQPQPAAAPATQYPYSTAVVPAAGADWYEFCLFSFLLLLLQLPLCKHCQALAATVVQLLISAQTDLFCKLLYSTLLSAAATCCMPIARLLLTNCSNQPASHP